jgi:hypothetical protein
VALCVSVAAVLTGCSGSVRGSDVKSSDDVVTGLTVGGGLRQEPVVRMRTPLKIEETTSAVTVAGTGAPIQVDQLFVIELSLYDARTGKAAVVQHPVAAKSSDNTLFPVLDDALVGAREGSRVVLAVTAEDAFGSGGTPPEGIARTDPVVVVADVVAVPPSSVLDAPDGRPSGAQPAEPRVVLRDGVPARVDTSGLREPDRLQVYPVLAGTGPAVAVPDLVTLDVLGQKWGSSEPLEDTFFKEPALYPLGAGRVPASWDRALDGVRRGSRILMIDPGDPRGTMLWVVDVLGVS